MLESENPPTFTKTVSVRSPNIFFLLKGQERVLTKFLVKIKMYQPLLREIQWKVWKHKVRGVFLFVCLLKDQKRRCIPQQKDKEGDMWPPSHPDFLLCTHHHQNVTFLLPTSSPNMERITVHRFYSELCKQKPHNLEKSL